ncbi:VanW family protein [Saccharopolyspora sp. CA-218241]|uniref:VanW family protein n=1 Tax=Saccharopolyspora sp. CA-218241 TaxID=3240027 RepID=UPI003D98BC52
MSENHDRRHGGEEPTERLSAGPETSAEQTQRIPPVDDRTRPDVPRPPAETDAERTEQIAALPSDFPGYSAHEATRAIPRYPEPPQQQPQPPQQPQSPRGRKSGLVKAGIAAGSVVGALALLYLGDLALSSGTVPRGTVVADVAIGGLEPAAAEQRLRTELEPRLDDPVQLQVGDNLAPLDPAQAGLRMDWAATVEHAGSQPLNPFTRISSLFSTREVAPVNGGDRDQLVQALEEVKPRLDRAPAEGTIRFEGTRPVPVDPVTGRSVDVAAAADTVLADWADEGPVRLPFSEQQVSTTADGVRQAVREVARPAVSAPVTVRGEGKDAQLTPETMAAALRFEPDGQGGLKASIDVPAAVAGVEPQLADTIKPGKDAQIVVEGGRPVVKPSSDGIGIDWGKSFENLLEVAKREQDRSVRAIYVHEPAELTTDEANALGVREVVGEFTTRGFEQASGVNIRRTAEEVNGALVKPGEVFSLNGHTGPRGVEQGYVESGIIEDGRPAKAVGGGISQFATTIYNAAYFAGMQDVEHKPHSYYISRYPEGRESTVFQSPSGKSLIDVKFKNVSDSGILITTQWTPSSITVKLWGTKQFDVSSEIGPRTDPTQPEEKVIPPGEPCSPSSGIGGFTVTDTRTIRNIKTGEVRTERQTTVYKPQPIIHCGGPPPAPGAAGAPPR